MVHRTETGVVKKLKHIIQGVWFVKRLDISSNVAGEPGEERRKEEYNPFCFRKSHLLRDCANVLQHILSYMYTDPHTHT